MLPERSTWRQKAAVVVAEVIRQVGREDQSALRKALVDAYPFGARANYPYKAWCQEVRRQVGERNALPGGQGELFGLGPAASESDVMRPPSVEDTTPEGMAALYRSRGVRDLHQFESYVNGRLGREAGRALRESGALRRAWEKLYCGVDADENK